MGLGQVGCKEGRMQEKKDARMEGCRKEGVKTVRLQERRVLNRRDTEWERYWTGGIKDS